MSAEQFMPYDHFHMPDTMSETTGHAKWCGRGQVFVDETHDHDTPDALGRIASALERIAEAMEREGR